MLLFISNFLPLRRLLCSLSLSTLPAFCYQPKKVFQWILISVPLLGLSINAQTERIWLWHKLLKPKNIFCQTDDEMISFRKKIKPVHWKAWYAKSCRESASWRSSSEINVLSLEKRWIALWNSCLKMPCTCSRFVTRIRLDSLDRAIITHHYSPRILHLTFQVTTSYHSISII